MAKDSAKPIKAFFIGTPQYAAEIFDALVLSPALKEHDITWVGLLCNPDKPAGRKQELLAPPTKTTAARHSIPVFQPEDVSDAVFLDGLRKLKPDVMVMCAYGKILPKEILTMAKHGIINIHYSLLPRWRGASPVQYALLNGDTTTGVTLILTDEQMDHGPILAFEETPATEADDADSLIRTLTASAITLAEKTIPLHLSGQCVPAPQNDGTATYCRMIRKEDAKIDWGNTSKKISDQVRALMLWPVAFTYIKLDETCEECAPNMDIGMLKEANVYKQIKIKKAAIGTVSNSENLIEPGKVFLNKQNFLCVKTGDGAIIIERLQMEGKQETDTASFVNGNSWIIGKHFIS
jgi:methionyl-tRNA formyltransferase